MNPQQLLQTIFNKTLHHVSPQVIVQNNVKFTAQTLVVGEHSFPLPKSIHVFGSGKAAITMAKALCSIATCDIAGGLIVSNVAHEKFANLEIIESSHPIPTTASLNAGKLLHHKMSQLAKDDFFIYLLSGGTSALIEKLPENISLTQLQSITKELMNKGADIHELNTVRKSISLIKGGKLAQDVEANGIVLVISDVIGDDLSIIGSGPLYSQPIGDTQEILNRYQLEIPKITPPKTTKKIPHHIIGNNYSALLYAKKLWEDMGISAHIMTSRMKGEAKEVAKIIVAIAEEVYQRHQPFTPPVCLIFGGETTVHVTGDGNGGRNQELALAALQEIKNNSHIHLLSAGTDGIDGNSDAAGAIVSSKNYHPQQIERYLSRNDSYHFFEKYGGLITTGKTGTNVMDIVMVLVTK